MDSPQVGPPPTHPVLPHAALRLVEPERDRAAQRRPPQLSRDSVLVQPVTRLVDHRPQRRADVALVEAGGDPDVGGGNRGREGVHRGVEAPGALLQRQLRHHLAGERCLGIDREVAMKAGVVDGVTAVGDLGHQRADAVAKRLQHRAHLRGAHSGLEVVQQGVVGALEALEPIEALGVAALQLHVSLQVGQVGGEVRTLLGVDPGVLGERGGPRDLGPQLGRHPSRLLPLPACHPHQARVVGVVRQAVYLAARLVEQPAEIVGDQALVTNPRQRCQLLGARLSPRRRHLRPLVPVQKSPRPAEVADLGKQRSQLLQLARHAGKLSRRPTGHPCPNYAGSC